MENQINIDEQDNQKITGNAGSSVLQKPKESRIIIFVVLLAILSLGGLFVGIYYRQKQIVADQERKRAEFPKSENILDATNDTTVNWSTYNFIDNSLMFKYPNDWQAEKAEVFGSRTVTEFKYKNTQLFELMLQENYNQITGKPYNNLNEFLGPRLIKSKDIFIDGHAAKKIEDQGEPGHIIPYEEAIVFTPDNKTIVNLYYKGSYYDKPAADGILDQILSTFKFINPENTEATANAISYNIPSDWQTFTNSLGKSKLTFRYPLEVSAQYNDYSIKQSVQMLKGNRLLLDISLPGYFGFKEYQSGSRREWFLENAKRNATVQNITFYPINFANGNSFYQVKAFKLNNLFGIIPVEPQINVYFGVIEDKTIIIRDWKTLPQEDVFRVLQSIRPQVLSLTTNNNFHSSNWVLTKTANYSFSYPNTWREETKNMDGITTLNLIKSGAQIIDGRIVPQIFLGTPEIFSTSGTLCGNASPGECEDAGHVKLKVKEKTYAAPIIKKRIWKSGQLSDSFYYIFQIYMGQIPTTPTVTAVFSNLIEGQEIVDILSVISY